MSTVPQAVANLGHTKGAVTSLSFSENGYYLATTAGDGVKLWDLRKLKNFRTLAPAEGGGPTASVDFDRSGLFLAVGWSDARVYGVKQDWDVVQTFPDLPQQVRSVPLVHRLKGGVMAWGCLCPALPGESCGASLGWLWPVTSAAASAFERTCFSPPFLQSPNPASFACRAGRLLRQVWR